MAITRTEIAKQLLANGGRIGFKGGADMGTVDAKDKKGNVTSKGKKSKGYRDWLEKRNEKRYYLMRQEYYDRKMTKADYQESVQ